MQMLKLAYGANRVRCNECHSLLKLQKQSFIFELFSGIIGTVLSLLSIGVAIYFGSVILFVFLIVGFLFVDWTIAYFRELRVAGIKGLHLEEES